MLDFCARPGGGAEFKLIPIRETYQALGRMLKTDLRYRIAIDLASLKAGAP